MYSLPAVSKTDLTSSTVFARHEACVSLLSLVSSAETVVVCVIGKIAAAAAVAAAISQPLFERCTFEVICLFPLICDCSLSDVFIVAN